jgi:hypothetical protein
MTTPKAVKKDTFKESPEFAQFISLLSLVSRVTNDLSKIATTANEKLFEILEKEQSNFALLQSTLTEAEQELKQIALKHPEWFGTKKSITTPFGSVSTRPSSKLVPMDSEDASIALIEREAEINKEFKPEDFLHFKKSLNLEALEKKDDKELIRFRIKREKKENFSIKPAKVEVGKSVQQATSEEAEKEAA